MCLIIDQCAAIALKVPVNPKIFISLIKCFYSSERNGTKKFVLGQVHNFLRGCEFVFLFFCFFLHGSRK